MSDNSRKILLATEDYNLPTIHVQHIFLSKKAPLFVINSESTNFNKKLNLKPIKRLLLKIIQMCLETRN